MSIRQTGEHLRLLQLATVLVSNTQYGFLSPSNKDNPIYLSTLNPPPTSFTLANNSVQAKFRPGQ